jgi:protein AFG1
MRESKLMNQTKLFASSEVPIFQVFSDRHSSGSAMSNDHMQEGMSDP